ncbi:MAG: helix-turn-helix domain-containing protein [Patescibacteria group bacterium]|nr:helix-turn-helix domain-containing protein [Patescibacteria group bacterium]
MGNKLYRNLLDLGLNRNEAEVYLTMLSLGEISILGISRACSVKRTTVYPAIESLKKMGLIRSHQRGFKHYYVAEDPEQLYKIFDKKRQELKSNLSEFSALYKGDGGGGIIKQYDGIEAVKNIFDDVLDDFEPGDEYLVMSDFNKFTGQDEKYFKSFISKRSKKMIDSRMLLQDAEIAIRYKRNWKLYKVRVKLLPEDVKLSINLTITPKKIIIHQLVAPAMAIVIENKNVVKMNKEMFELIWRSIE